MRGEYDAELLGSVQYHYKVPPRKYLEQESVTVESV